MKEIDWEQRRYEIAKEIYPTIFKEAYDDYNIEEIASFAVRYADALIAELKKKDKQMKATELKINDWVSYRDEEPVKIAELGLALCSLWDKNEDFHGDISIDYLSPIPLTSEILEKNGWKKGNEIWGIDYIKDRLHIAFFSKSKDMVAMVSSINDSDMCVCLRHIKFVHELQHLLWALGIDDDLKI